MDDSDVAGIITAEPETILIGRGMRRYRLEHPIGYKQFVEEPIRGTTAILSHETLHGVLENMHLGRKGWLASDAMDRQLEARVAETPYYGIAIQKAQKFKDEEIS